MADVCDMAQEAEETIQAQRDKRRPEFVLPPGEPGECQYCGEDSLRLIGGACAPCRERRRLP